MKTIINSCKRTHWFKLSMALFSCLLFLVIPSCQKDELDQSSILNMDNMSPSKSSKPNTNKLKQGEVMDVEGNVYKTVKIGKQWWMAENLKTTRYSDGTPIQLIEDGAEWFNLTNLHLTTPAYCYYNNDVALLNIYGALYNWIAVDTGSNGGKKLCPTKWHVPTDADWFVLIKYLDESASHGETFIESETAGDKLKEVGRDHFYSNNYATNESGFTGLGSGYRTFTGDYLDLLLSGLWWSSTENESIGVWYRCLSSDYSWVGRWYDSYKNDGMSIRCIKNN